MEYKLLNCEQCLNIVSVKDNNELTFICPACGTINKREQYMSYHGRLTLQSPEMDCGLNNEEKGENFINIIDADDDLISAIMLLSKYGWTMKFVGTPSKKDKDN